MCVGLAREIDKNIAMWIREEKRREEIVKKDNVRKEAKIKSPKIGCKRDLTSLKRRKESDQVI